MRRVHYQATSQQKGHLTFPVFCTRPSYVLRRRSLEILKRFIRKSSILRMMRDRNRKKRIQSATVLQTAFRGDIVREKARMTAMVSAEIEVFRQGGWGGRLNVKNIYIRFFIGESDILKNISTCTIKPTGTILGHQTATA